MMKLAICDDDLVVHEQIYSLLEDEKFSHLSFDVIDFNSGEELLDYYSSGEKADIIFLDIEMETTSGIEAAQKIRETDEDTIIIFISSHSCYIFESFRVEALHFMIKPIDEYEFFDVFTRAIQKFNRTRSFLPLQKGNELYKIKIDDIVFVESYMRHIAVHTTSEVIEAVGKLSELLKALEPHGFIRIHQGFIVNMNYIKKIDKKDVVLTDDKKLSISVRKRNDTMLRFSDYLKKWKW